MTTAKELGSTSLQLTKERDRDGWLALFAPDAVIEDPVGSEPHRGIEAITAFHDSTILMTESFEYEIERSYAGAHEAALVIHFTIEVGGAKLDMDAVNIYTATEDGKIQSLRSFWDGTRQGAAS